MQTCLTCSQTTKNPRFCSRKCAAIYNIVQFPTEKAVSGRRKKTKKCKSCDVLVYSRQVYCNDCYVAWKSRTPECNKKRVAKNVTCWRQRAKLLLVEYKGGKCELCGYNKSIPGAYAFHHKNPEEKDFGIAGKTISLERMKVEADKCMLLCQNCHAEIHYNISQETRQPE